MRYWEPPAGIVLHRTSLIFAGIFFFAKAGCPWDLQREWAVVFARAPWMTIL